MAYLSTFIQEYSDPEKFLYRAVRDAKSAPITRLCQIGISPQAYNAALVAACNQLDEKAFKKFSFIPNALKLLPNAKEIAAMRALNALIEAKEKQSLPQNPGVLARLFKNLGLNDWAMWAADIERGFKLADAQPMMITTIGAAGGMAGCVLLSHVLPFDKGLALAAVATTAAVMAHGAVETLWNALVDGRGDRLRKAAVDLSGCRTYTHMLNTYSV